MPQISVENGLLSGALGLTLLASAAFSRSQAAQLQMIRPCSANGTSPTNLQVCASSFLGGSTEDEGVAVEVAPDGTVVLGGRISSNSLSQAPTRLKAGSQTSTGGQGAIVRTSFDGRKVLSVTQLGKTIDDLDVHRNNGKIAVAGDFGVALLDQQAQQVLWSKSLGSGGGATSHSGRRVTVGTGGQVAALFNKQVTVFDESGRQLGQFQPGGTYIEDVAIASDRSTVIVTGFSQKDNGRCRQLQVAFVRGYSYTGDLKWKNYDWSHAEAHGRNESCADSRGLRVRIGRDNKLYFVGESAGGNSIYRYDPRNLAQDAPNVSFDRYNTPYNMRAEHITYYARMNLEGVIERGQFALARGPRDQGNTMRPRSITADEAGNVYIGGISAGSIPDRDRLKISGRAIGPYKGGDGFLLVVSPDFRTRRALTTWTGTGSPKRSTIFGVAAGRGVAAIVGTADGDMMTVNPIQDFRGGKQSAFFSVFPAF